MTRTTRNKLTIACQHDCGEVLPNADERAIRFTCGGCLDKGKPRQPMQLRLDGGAEEPGSTLS